jgi:hypothetical protein
MFERASSGGPWLSLLAALWLCDLREHGYQVIPLRAWIALL